MLELFRLLLLFGVGGVVVGLAAHRVLQRRTDSWAPRQQLKPAALLLLALASGAALLAYPLLSALKPELLPAPLRSPAPFLLDYAEAHRRWEAALAAGAADEAVGWADELLMTIDGQGIYARDAAAMRLAAVRKGARAPDDWRYRPKVWLWQRVAARRPLLEWIAAAAGAWSILVIAPLSLLSLLRRRPAPARSMGPRPGP